MTGATSNHPSTSASAAPDSATAQLAVARFRDASAEIRGCAVLGPAGLLAATGDGERWSAAAAELLEAADAAAGGIASNAHVATEEGEVYVVRLAGLAMVAVTDRFTLASLVLADLRAALRGLLIAPPHASEREAA